VKSSDVFVIASAKTLESHVFTMVGTEAAKLLWPRVRIGFVKGQKRSDLYFADVPTKNCAEFRRTYVKGLVQNDTIKRHYEYRYRCGARTMRQDEKMGPLIELPFVPTFCVVQTMPGSPWQPLWRLW